MLKLLAIAALAAGAAAVVDGGDSGDAGALAASPVDAGPVVGWVSLDAGVFNGTGVTDRVTVRVDQRALMHLGGVSIMSQCDAPLVKIEGDQEQLVFIGQDAGTTQCGFWLLKATFVPGAQPFPDRLVEVTVLPKSVAPSER